MRADADTQAAATREEASGHLESVRARAAQAAADFETALAKRRQKAEADHMARTTAAERELAETVARTDQLRAEAEKMRADAERRSQEMLAAAQRESGELVAEARAQADRTRRESERELASLSKRRDAITDQLRNVREMLSTLTGGAVATEPEPAAADEPEDEPARRAAPAQRRPLHRPPLDRPGTSPGRRSWTRPGLAAVPARGPSPHRRRRRGLSRAEALTRQALIASPVAGHDLPGPGQRSGGGGLVAGAAQGWADGVVEAGEEGEQPALLGRVAARRTAPPRSAAAPRPARRACRGRRRSATTSTERRSAGSVCRRTRPSSSSPSTTPVADRGTTRNASASSAIRSGPPARSSTDERPPLTRGQSERREPVPRPVPQPARELLHGVGELVGHRSTGTV